MKCKPEKLFGEYYFSSSGLPLAVKRVEGKKLSHSRDYTGIPHTHAFLELAIITGGNGTQSIDGVESPVQAGDVFVLQGRTAHWFPEYSALKLTNLMFSRSLFASQLGFLQRIPGFNVIFRVGPSVRAPHSYRHHLHLSMTALAHAIELTDELDHELSAQAPGWEAAATALLLSLVVFLSRQYHPDTTDRTAVSRLGHLLAELEAHADHPWDLAVMARQVCLSVNQFLRIFKAATGEPPMKYLTRLRLKSAAELLRTTTLSITQVAEAAGFPDSNYFAKRFAAQYGCAPRDYRKG